MASQFKSSSVNDLANDEENGEQPSGLFNGTSRKLSFRSMSMPSIIGDESTSSQSKLQTSDFDFSIGNLSETLPTTKETSDEYLDEESHDDSRDDDDYYDETSHTPSHTQQDSSRIIGPYPTASDTGVDVDSVTDMSIDEYMDSDPPSIEVKELSKLKTLKDIQFQIDLNNWFCDKDTSLPNAGDKCRDIFLNKYAGEGKEVENASLRVKMKTMEEELRKCKDAEKQQVDENRRIYEDHQRELQRIKKEGMQDSKKQFTEMKHLHTIIEKLEKKLGFEAGFCLQVRPGTGELDDALSKVKIVEMWDEKGEGGGGNKWSNDKSTNGECDMSALVNELPGRLLSRPHNDPERVLHRKIVELSSLIRKLDEKNQQLAIRNEELIQEIEEAKDADKRLEERTTELGAKNMELIRQLRKLEQTVKEYEEKDCEKEERIVQLQELVEKKDKKLRSNKKKVITQDQVDEYEDIERQNREQLQIISELRQLALEKERKIDLLKKRYAADVKQVSSIPTRSVSVDSLNFICEELPVDSEATTTSPPDNAAMKKKKREELTEGKGSNRERLQRLTKEHLELQHAYALLQQQVGDIIDPQRAQLNRESLQSDLLVSQATINELEAQLQDKEKRFGRSVEEYHSNVGTVKTMEEKNEDLHQKLIDAESHLMEKTMLLKKLTEEMKEVMDQNDLMEFRITEMENVLKPKAHQHPMTPEDDLNESIGGEVNAISVRISLKELEINKQHCFSSFEKKSLVQARAYVDKLEKENLTLKRNDMVLKKNIGDLTKRYEQSQNSLVEQGNELNNFWKETSKNEEAELLKLGGITSPFGKMMSDLEENPAKLLGEAKSRIQDLEQTNDILLKKMEARDQGNKGNLSEEEVGLLYKKVDQLRDAEKQINMLKIANDELLLRIQRFEMVEVTQNPAEGSKSPGYTNLPDALAEEIYKLKRENEELNSEMGTLRVRADDALAIAQKTKEVLNKEDQETQTPSEESFDFFRGSNTEQRKLIDAAIQTAFNDDYMKKFQNLTIGHVIKNNKSADTTATTADLQQNDVMIRDLDDAIFSDEGSRKGSDVTNVDASQLQADQEYIEKVLENLQDCGDEEEENTEYVFHTSLPEGKTYRQPDDHDSRSDGNRTGSSFSGYLKKQEEVTDFSVKGKIEDEGEERSSRSTSHRSSMDLTHDDSTSFCHVDDGSVKSSSTATTKPPKHVRSQETTSPSTYTLITTTDGNTSTDTTRRVSSTCSTCGLTPPLLNHKSNIKKGGIYSTSMLRDDNSQYQYDGLTETSKDKSFNCVCETCGSTTPSDDIPDTSNSGSLTGSEVREPPPNAREITRCPTCGVNPSHIIGDPANLDCVTCSLIMSYQNTVTRRSSNRSSVSSHEQPIRSSDDYATKIYGEDEEPLGESKPCRNCGMTSQVHPHIPSNICSICGFTSLQSPTNDTPEQENILNHDIQSDNNGASYCASSSYGTSYDSAVITVAATEISGSNVDAFTSHVASSAHVSPTGSDLSTQTPFKSLLSDGTALKSPRDLGDSKYEYYGHTTGRVFTPENENTYTNVETDVEKLLDYGKRLQEDSMPANDDVTTRPLPDYTDEPMRRQSDATSTVSNDSVRACHKIEYDDASNSSISDIHLTLPKLSPNSNNSPYGISNTDHASYNAKIIHDHIPSYYNQLPSSSLCGNKINASSSSYMESADYLVESSKPDTTYASKSRGKNYKSEHNLLGDVPSATEGPLDGTLVGVKDFTMSEALNNDDSISVSEVKDEEQDISVERKNFQTMQTTALDGKSFPESSKSEPTSYLDADVNKTPYSTATIVGFTNIRRSPPTPGVPVSIKLSHLPLPGVSNDKRYSIDITDFSKPFQVADDTPKRKSAKDSVFGFASSKYKFPSDSELSKQSGSSSDIENFIMTETRKSTRRLPQPGKRRRSPSRSPPHLLTRRNSDMEYRSRFARSIDNHHNDGETTSPTHNGGGLNEFDLRTPRYKLSDVPSLCREINFLRQETDSLERQLMNKETVVRAMQDELKEESENMAILEQKDKEITLKSESLSQITQLLQKTKKELEHKSSECNRRENEIKHIREELKSISDEKKVLEHSLSEQQLKIIKLESAETRLLQMTEKYDQVLAENRELVERIKNLEINEKEFIDLERNVIELQTQLHDMEDIELHRDELLVKLQDVKKQRDEFLEKGKMVEEERNEFVRSNKTLEQYILEWKRKTTEFKKTNQGLKDRIMGVEKDKKELEGRIQEIQAERTSMQTVINKLEGERDDLLREMREMKLDRQAMEAKTADLEEAMYDYDHLEEGFHSLRLKLAELTRQRDDTELLIPSYKAKVKVLKKTVREKEETIMQLSHEIKTMKVIMENFTYDDLSHFKSISGMTSDSSHTNNKCSSYSKKYRPSDMNMTSESETYDLVMSRSQPPPGEYSDDSESFTKEEKKRNPSSRRRVEWI